MRPRHQRAMPLEDDRRTAPLGELASCVHPTCLDRGRRDRRESRHLSWMGREDGGPCPPREGLRGPLRRRGECVEPIGVDDERAGTAGDERPHEGAHAHVRSETGAENDGVALRCQGERLLRGLCGQRPVGTRRQAHGHQLSPCRRHRGLGRSGRRDGDEAGTGAQGSGRRENGGPRLPHRARHHQQVTVGPLVDPGARRG